MMNKALKDLQEGRPVLIYDFGDREGETDLVYPAENIQPKQISHLRNDGGGLVCTAIHPHAAEKLGLPFLADTINHPATEEAGELKYDSRSSFSLWVNHKSNYTGITDKDRAKTARELANAVKTVLEGKNYNFANEFRTPGHTAVLRAADDLTEERQGQTEMSVELTQRAGLTPAAVICEMLDDESGRALSREDAMEYANNHDLAFLEGNDFVKIARH